MTYECKCVGPWRGIYCGVGMSSNFIKYIYIYDNFIFLANACYKSPCQNSGTCLNVHDDYWCKCTNDYYGKIEFIYGYFHSYLLCFRN
jgi:hypothetical protein